MDLAAWEKDLDRVLLPDSYRQRDNFGPYTVPEDHYFCLGDNRDNSNDSRFWGPVPAEYVRGRAFMIYWSFDSHGGDGGTPAALAGDHVARPGPFNRFRQLGWTLSHLFTRTRWERSFKVVR